MSGEFASNCPVSRPRKMPWDVDWDCNGLVWSNDFGIFFDAVAEQPPLREPSPPRSIRG